MTVRFWQFINDSPVRLALSARHPRLTFEGGGPTEEGYRSLEAEYRLVGDYIERETWSDERDCDGRVTSHTVARCRLDRLDDHRYDDAEACYPVWEILDERHRDYSAERMGY